MAFRMAPDRSDALVSHPDCRLRGKNPEKNNEDGGGRAGQVIEAEYESPMAKGKV